MPPTFASEVRVGASQEEDMSGIVHLGLHGARGSLLPALDCWAEPPQRVGDVDRSVPLNQRGSWDPPPRSDVRCPAPPDGAKALSVKEGHRPRGAGEHRRAVSLHEEVGIVA